jgi:hypothetical protein
MFLTMDCLYDIYHHKTILHPLLGQGGRCDETVSRHHLAGLWQHPVVHAVKDQQDGANIEYWILRIWTFWHQLVSKAIGTNTIGPLGSPGPIWQSSHVQIIIQFKTIQHKITSHGTSCLPQIPYRLLPNHIRSMIGCGQFNLLSRSTWPLQIPQTPYWSSRAHSKRCTASEFSTWRLLNVPPGVEKQ